MSSHARSLEDAAEHIIDTLKHFLQVNTLFIATNDGFSKRILRAFNRHEQLIDIDQSCNSLSLSLGGLVFSQPDSVINIANTLSDPRTAAMPLSEQLGPCSFVGIAVKTTGDQLLASICLMDREPIILDENQIAFIQSLSSLFSYIIELENASVTDSLTGLYNRRYLSHLYRNESDKQFSVMFIDIDDFKEVNDSFGHDFGDLLLLEISARLKRSVRKTDILIRYGGDEFVICFQHLVDNHDIAFVAEKIQASIKEPFSINGQPIHISASIGVSSSPGRGCSLMDLISDADHAMYGIKQNEKNP